MKSKESITMKELYWVKVKRNNLPAFKFDKHLQSIKEVKENIRTSKKWMGEDQYLSEYVAQPKLDN